MKMKKKGMVASTLVFLIILSISLLIIIDIFTNGSIRKSINTAIDEIFIIEETDPTIWSRNFFEQRKEALENFAVISDAFKKAAESSQETCFATFPVIPEDFFDSEHALQFSKDGSDLSIILLQYRSDQVTTKKKKEIANFEPVSGAVKIPGFEPCVIMTDPSVQLFYQDILLDGEIDVSKAYGVGVQQLFMYPYRQIDVRIGSGNGETEYYYQGDKVNQYVILKNKGKLCVIPVENTGFFGNFNPWEMGCNSPSGGLIDEDCLDSDFSFQDNKIKLPHRLKEFVSGNDKNDYICDGFQTHVVTMVDVPRGGGGGGGGY